VAVAVSTDDAHGLIEALLIFAVFLAVAVVVHSVIAIQLARQRSAHTLSVLAVVLCGAGISVIAKEPAGRRHHAHIVRPTTGLCARIIILATAAHSPATIRTALVVLTFNEAPGEAVVICAGTVVLNDRFKAATYVVGRAILVHTVHKVHEYCHVVNLGVEIAERPAIGIPDGALLNTLDCLGAVLHGMEAILIGHRALFPEAHELATGLVAVAALVA